MKFKYKRYSKEILRPVIPVEICHKDRSVPYEVLVDSGADFCIFDAQIAEILGIDVLCGRKQKVWGITGVGESYYIHPARIKIGGWAYEIKVGFLPNIARLGYWDMV